METAEKTSESTEEVGASDKAELEQMELAVRVMPAPEADKIASLNAIHALLATLPNAESEAPSE